MGWGAGPPRRPPRTPHVQGPGLFLRRRRQRRAQGDQRVAVGAGASPFEVADGGDPQRGADPLGQLFLGEAQANTMLMSLLIVPLWYVHTPVETTPDDT